MVLSIPLHKRPLYVGLFGAVFGVASVAGPLVGGAFTSKVTWRWCFYINLPIGGVVLAVLAFILSTPKKKNTETLKQQLAKLDPIGTIVFLPGIVCLLLALQWGGTTYPWSNARIIALFILAGVLIGLFIYVQFVVGDRATVPIRIITQRSVAAGAFSSFIVPGSMMILVYYLPIWFQAIKGDSAVKSGVNTIPLVLALVVSSIFAGQLTSRTGYYVPQLIASSIIMSIGAGLLTTFKVDTNHEKYIGYQVLYGLGLGLGMQQASMAAQTCLERKDVTIGVALMFFFQGLGGAIWLAVGEVVFTNSLVKYLEDIPGITPDFIVHTGATDLRTMVPAQYLESVLVAYNKAIANTLYIPVGTAAVSIIAGLTMEWRNVKGMKQGGPSGPKKVEEDNQEADVVSEPAEKTANSEKISSELTDADTDEKSANNAAGSQAKESERPSSVLKQ
jgi:MFS family permease